MEFINEQNLSVIEKQKKAKTPFFQIEQYIGDDDYLNYNFVRIKDLHSVCFDRIISYIKTTKNLIDHEKNKTFLPVLKRKLSTLNKMLNTKKIKVDCFIDDDFIWLFGGGGEPIEYKGYLVFEDF